MSNKISTNKLWIPIWIDKWLFGSTRLEMEVGERAVWLDLLLIASKNNGYIRANESTPYPNSQLAGLLVIPVELLQSTIDKCLHYEKIKQLENGTYYVINWETYQLSGRHKRRLIEKKEKNQKKESKLNKSKLEYNRVEYNRVKGVPENGHDVLESGHESKINTDKRNPDLQEIINYALEKGFSLQGNQQKNRQYAWNLLRKKDPNGIALGKDRIKELIDMAVACRGENYCPVINDFKNLYLKWQDLISFLEKKKKGGRIG